MSEKTLTLSLVIPAYNEEHHLKACLDAIAAQTVMPDEVIVVDNNSTDKTVEIAKRYPFVKVVHESMQGRGPARTRGFNEAGSDIIGRIDADSVVSSGWVERVKQDFADPALMGVTGLGRAHTIPRIYGLHTTFWSRVYFWNVHGYFGAMTTWGANMALRRKAWEGVKDRVCLDDNIVHEDQDVSLLIAGQGGKIIQDNKLLITIRGQSYIYLPKLLYYTRLRRRTKLYHKRLGALDSPEARRLSFWNTLLGRLWCVVPELLFFVGSLVLWPLDKFILHFDSKND